MCWKNEWAKAVNNINWALIHIERAKIKVERRNNSEAALESACLIGTLTNVQTRLKNLIDEHGISRVYDSKSTEKHMKGQRRTRGKVQAWVQKN